MAINDELLIFIKEFKEKIKILGNVLEHQPQTLSGQEPYVILPSIKSPRWLVPLRKCNLIGPSMALYQPSFLRAKVLKRLTILLGKIGFMKFMFRNVIFLERNDEEIRSIFSQDGLEYAVFMGTEGKHCKITIQVMNGEGNILGYIKVSNSHQTDELLDNEATKLRDLSGLEISSGFFPKVIYKGNVSETKILVLDSLKSTKAKFTNKLSKAHIDFFSEVFLKSMKPKNFDESAFMRSLKERVKTFEERLNYSWRERFRKVINFLVDRLGDRKLPFGLCHRDFTPWNTFLHNDKIFVFDWEYARNDYPPLLDIFHFIVQDGIIVKKLKPEKMLRRIFSHKRLIETYCNLVGIEKSLTNFLLLCYLLDISLLYIEREGGDLKGEMLNMVETWGGMIDLVIKRTFKP